MSYVQERMYAICAMSGLSYETITPENYQEITDALGFLSPREYYNLHAEMRSLYMDKYMMPFFDEVQ
jgi:hypothetical protein